MFESQFVAEPRKNKDQSLLTLRNQTQILPEFSAHVALNYRVDFIKTVKIYRFVIKMKCRL